MLFGPVLLCSWIPTRSVNLGFSHPAVNVFTSCVNRMQHVTWTDQVTLLLTARNWVVNKLEGVICIVIIVIQMLIQMTLSSIITIKTTPLVTTDMEIKWFGYVFKPKYIHKLIKGKWITVIVEYQYQTLFDGN